MMKLSSNLPVGKQINFQPYCFVNPRYHTSICSVSYRFQSIFMAKKSFKQENIRLATWLLTLQGRAFHQVKKSHEIVDCESWVNFYHPNQMCTLCKKLNIHSKVYILYIFQWIINHCEEHDSHQNLNSQ